MCCFFFVFLEKIYFKLYFKIFLDNSEQVSLFRTPTYNAYESTYSLDFDTTQNINLTNSACVSTAYDVNNVEKNLKDITGDFVANNVNLKI